MSAMHAELRARVDVELSVDNHVVACVDRDGGSESRVVVNLEHLAGRDLDLESFVTAGLHGVVQRCGVEGHLGSIRVVDYVLVQRLVVWYLTPATRDADQRHQQKDPESPHVARACSRVMRPS